MKLKELTKPELCELTTQLLGAVSDYPIVQNIVYKYLFERWKEKQDALFDKASSLIGIEHFAEWKKVQTEIDKKANSIEYCTYLEELKD